MLRKSRPSFCLLFFCALLLSSTVFAGSADKDAVALPYPKDKSAGGFYVGTEFGFITGDGRK